MAEKFKFKRLVFPIIVVAIVAFLIIYKISSAEKQAAPAAAKGGPVGVTGYVVKSGTIDNSILSNGTLYAFDEIALKPEISGRITGIYFTEGGSVSNGQLLVKLFDADLQAEKKRLELQLELANTTETRLKELLNVNGVSRQEYDAALNNLHTIEADIALTEAKIAKTEIRAPFSGKIGLQKISNGAMVVPGDIIATLQQTQTLKVDFSVPEKYLPEIREKGEIEFTVEGFDQIFTADVYAIEPKIDLATRTVQIRAKYINKDGLLFPGSFVSVIMPLEVVTDGIMVPSQAIVPEIRGQKIFISDHGLAKPIMVTTGVRTDSMVQVIKGLNPGDTLITTGMIRLSEGSELKFTEIKTP